MKRPTIKPALILAFCVLYLSIQAFFIVRAHFVVDKRFGFWMFAESSRFKAELYREFADGRLEKALHGQWWVTTADGRYILYSWDNYVRRFRLNPLERFSRAKRGIGVTLEYFQQALDYVAERIPEDRETVKLVLRVQYRKAGGPWQYVALESRPRRLPG
jgi:hypothetical protein